MNNPFQRFTRKDWMLWLCSLLSVTVVHLLVQKSDGLTLIATWVGITSLIFAAKGNVWAQILAIVFSILYGTLSWQVRYYGEMIIQLGMTMPMAICATVSWLRNPSPNGKEVAIQRLTARHIAVLVPMMLVITAVSHIILKNFATPNLMWSTVSIAISFLALYLTVLRSSLYALAYAANDIVLMVLWTLASLQNPAYIPMVVNFAIFLINDLYGFTRWHQREQTLYKTE